MSKRNKILLFLFVSSLIYCTQMDAQTGFDPAFPQEDPSVYKQKKKKNNKKKKSIKPQKEVSNTIEKEEDSTATEEGGVPILPNHSYNIKSPGNKVVYIYPLNKPNYEGNQPISSNQATNLGSPTIGKVAITSNSASTAINTSPNSTAPPSAPPKDSKQYIKTKNVFGEEVIMVVDENNPAPTKRNNFTSEEIAKDTYVSANKTKATNTPPKKNTSKGPESKFNYNTDVMVPSQGSEAALGTSLIKPGETLEGLLNGETVTESKPKVVTPTTIIKESTPAVVIEKPKEKVLTSPTIVDPPKEKIATESIALPTVSKKTTEKETSSKTTASNYKKPETQKIELFNNLESLEKKLLAETEKHTPTEVVNKIKEKESTPPSKSKFAYEESKDILVPDPIYDAAKEPSKEEIKEVKEESTPPSKSKFAYEESKDILVPDPIYDAAKEPLKEEIKEVKEESTPPSKSKFAYEESKDILVPDPVYDAAKEVEKTKPKKEVTKPSKKPKSTATKKASKSAALPTGFMVYPIGFNSTTYIGYEAFKLKKLIEPTLTLGGSYKEKPVYSDEEYKGRLGLIPSLIPLEYNDNVKKYIHKYVFERRAQLGEILSRKDFYFPIIEAALDRYQVPLEFKYITVIESALNPRISDQNGNSGLWLMPLLTARSYGLDMNSLIDERRDPYLSSDATARYFKSLYDKFGDWQLVLAAYSAGESEVVKALEQSISQLYIDVAEFLPANVKEYKDMYTAAVYAMNFYLDHNISITEPVVNYYGIDTVHIKKKTDIRQLAPLINVPIKELNFINPAIKENIIPATVNGYPLNIPMDRVADFEQYRTGSVAKTPRAKEAIKKTSILYLVKEGDNLEKLARQFKCEVGDLKRWNNFNGEGLIEGEVINAFVPVKDFEEYWRVHQYIRKK